jgi:HlyD family secretion protein
VQKLETQAKVDELESNVQQELREQARLGAVLRSSSAAPNADYRGRIETNLRQIADLDRQIREAKLQLQYSELKAPASGTVFDLDARRGSVANAAQPLLKVVPNDALRAKVYVPSSAIGFIHTGQRADLSLDTFPAADYGRLEATVVRVGSDALTPEKQKEALGTEAAGLHYPAVLELSRQSLQAGQRLIPLQPGMGLTADIHLRQRRMINVLTGFFEDKLRSLERMR